MPEPTLIEQPRVAAEAWIGEKPTAGGPISPEKEMAGRLRSEVAKDISPRQAMEGIAPHPPPTEARWKFVNNENIGIARKGGDGEDAGEKVYDAGTRTEKLNKRADKNARIAQELLSKGYEVLPKTDKEYMTKQLTSAAMSNPEVKAVLEALPDDDARRQKIEDLFLRNPQFLKKLSARFGELYDGEDAVLKDLVSEAEDDYKRTAGEFGRKDTEANTLSARINAIETRLKEFTVGGKDYEAFSKFDSVTRRNMEQNQLKLDDLKQKEKELEGTFYRGVRYSEEDRREMLKGVRSQIEGIEEQLKPKLDTFEEWKKLDGEKERLEKELEGLKVKEPEIQNSLADLQIKKDQAERKRNIARATRAVEEEQFTNEVEDMFAEAGKRFMEQELKRHEAAQGKIAKEAIEKAQDADESHIQKAMKAQWRRDEKRGRRTLSKVNKTEVMVAYDQMIKSGSAEDFVKQFMQQGVIDARAKYGAGSVQEQEELRRLEGRFKDKDFMKKMNAVVAQRLLETYLEAGGKVGKEDVTLLNQTEWGDSVIDGAIAQNAKSGPTIEKLQKINGFQGSKKEFIKAVLKNPNAYKTAGLGGLGLLALIMGAPFLIAGGSIVGGLWAKGAEAAIGGMPYVT